MEERGMYAIKPELMKIQACLNNNIKENIKLLGELEEKGLVRIFY